MVFIEKWTMPEKYKDYFTVNSPLSASNIMVNGKIIPVSSFYQRKSSSYNKINTPLSEFITKNPITNVSELEKFIDMQFRTSETDHTSNVFVYDLIPFTDWVESPNGQNFHPVAYDGFKQFFTENDGNKVTVSTGVRSSCVRDKAALFPWNDLLNGDATNKAEKGAVTWNWIRELVEENGKATFSTFIVVAEVIFADYIVPGEYTKPDGSTAISTVTFWREIVKISKFDRTGNEIWSMNIYYDEEDTMPETEAPAFWFDSNYPLFGTLFGTGIKNRELNDGVSTNVQYDSNGNKVLRTVKLWNSKTINSVNDSVADIANEQHDMTFINWQKTVDVSVPSYFSENRLDLISMLSSEYKLTTDNAISIHAPTPMATWFLCMPGENYEGMLIADSKLAFNPATRTDQRTDTSYVIYNDTTIPVSGASVGLVKEFIS